MTQRRWIPGRFVLEDTAGSAGGGAALAEVVPLLQEWVAAKFPNAIPEGLDTLTPETLLEWLKDQVAGAKSDSELGLSSAAPSQMGKLNMRPAGELPPALSNTAEGRRRKIAADIAKRRGIPLADALQFVPR